MIMRKLTDREKMIFGVCIVLCLFFVGKHLVFRPLVEYRGELMDRIKVVRHKIAEARRFAAKESACDARREALSGIIGVAGVEGSETAHLVSKVEEVARQVYVRVVNVQPQTMSQKKFYYVYSLEIVIEGDWGSIARFIHLLQIAEPSLAIDQMRLEKIAENALALRGRIFLTWIRLKPAAH
jgi:hypothetical protein